MSHDPPCYFVDLVNAQTEFKHCLNNGTRAKYSYAVGHKVGGVLTDNHTLTQCPFAEVLYEVGYFRQCFVARYDLQQPHITGRIKEVHSYKVLFKLGRTSFTHFVNRKTRGVGGYN